MDTASLPPVDHRIARDGGVATVVLDRPHAYNALTTAMIDSLLVTLNALDRDPEVGAIVVTGAGKGFCSGQALDDATVIAEGTWSIGSVVSEHYNPLILALLQCATPTVAAINGRSTS